MTICDRFQYFASKYPLHPALISESEGYMTYQELNDYSNSIATNLLCQHSESEAVGLYVQRSFSLIAGMLGIMKAGKAYVPLDPCYPVDYLAQMLEVSQVSCILCAPGTEFQLSEQYDCIPLQRLEQKISADEINLARRESAACILFTSGSTGLPNGVIMTHEAILNTLDWAIMFYHLSCEDVDLQIPSCSFTSSVQDIFSTLLSGGTLVMLDEKKMINARYLNMLSIKYKVTHFDMVPSLYKEYLSIVSKQSALRFVLLAGEPLSIELVREHFNKYPSVRLVNEYGMAETCSCSFVKEMMPTDTVVTIGSPITNITYKIVDPDEDGVGELYIAGNGLAKGYRGNEAYTIEKFIYLDNVRHLKTGDYVREYGRGEIQFICRKDNQIKVNGKRINLQDIDAVLMQDKHVMDACTTVMSYHDRQLIVSFIKATIHETDYFSELLKKRLPVHALPNYIKVVDSFLYLPNKKRNIKEMLENFKKEINEKQKDLPEQHKELIQIISEVTHNTLSYVDVDVDIRFQGMDSITFIQFLVKVEEKYGFEFGYDDIETMGKVSVKTIDQYIKNIKE